MRTYPQGNRLMAATLSFTPALSVAGTREARTVVIRNFTAEIRNQLARQGAR